MAGNFWKSSHYEQWILSSSDLLRSRAEDLKILSEDEYQKVMIYFVNYMHALVTEGHLGCREQLIATACVFFRRFYSRRSLKDIDPFLLSLTCLYLACRVEECGLMSINKLVNAINITSKTRPWFPTFNEKEFKNYYLKLINEAEFYLIEILDCCLIVYHPYRTLMPIIHEIIKANPKEKETVQDAWRIVNDSLRTDACLLYPPNQIAIASFMLSVTLNNKEELFKQWFQDVHTDYDAIFEIIKLILNAYKLHEQIVDCEKNTVNIKNLLSLIPKPQSDQQPQSQNIF